VRHRRSGAPILGRLRARLLPLVALAVLAVLAGPAVAAHASAKPSVVLIVTDDQRWDTLGRMANVEKLVAAHGVTFTNAFVQDPACCPSRATILTGRFANDTGVLRNGPPFGGFASFDDRSTIATWLGAAGLRTALVGKYLNGYQGVDGYVPPGWDRWAAFTTLGYYDFALSLDGRWQSYSSSSYSTYVLTDQAVSFIRDTRGPLLLVYTPFAPHAPAEPATRDETAYPKLTPFRPPSYDEADVSDKPAWLRSHTRLAHRGANRFRRHQLETLLAVDRGVGRIVRALQATHRLHHTLLVFMSDNGVTWGEHRLVDWKFAPYDEMLRVPLVVRYDPLTRTPRRDTHLVLNADVAPTAAALEGLHPKTDGQSLLRLLAGTSSGWRTAFPIEHLRERALPESKIPSWCGVRFRRFTYAVYANGAEELYALANDRYELRNRARDPAYSGTRRSLLPRLMWLCHPPPPGMSLGRLCMVRGTPGDDALQGGPRGDVVCGSGGDDLLLPRGASDYVDGGAGNDRIRVRDGVRDFVRCGPGNDRVVADRRDVVAPDCETIIR